MEVKAAGCRLSEYQGAGLVQIGFTHKTEPIGLSGSVKIGWLIARLMGKQVI
jgi:hypothetical protein